MVNNILKVIFFFLAILFAFLLYRSIKGEIEYRAEVDRVEELVIGKLEKIREAELAYKDVKGEFTGDYDTLINFIKTGKLKILVEYGDKDDSTSVFRQEVEEVSILDSMFSDFNVDSIAFVPPSDTAKFVLLASRVIQGNVEVPVFQVTDPWPFDKQRANPNHPKKALQVGSISEASYSGNWK
jgi:predicted membrane protein